MSFPGIWGRVRKEEGCQETEGSLNADRAAQLKAGVMRLHFTLEDQVSIIPDLRGILRWLFFD
jgi:hypothetical protein